MEAARRTFLVVDDDPGDIEILRRHLDEIEEWEVELLGFTAPESALAELAGREVDLIFVDYFLGAGTGLDVFRAIRKSGYQRPVIMLTGQGNEMVAVEAMKAGVSDYLVKELLGTDGLRRAIANALEKAALRDFQNELLGMAAHDLRSPIGIIRGYGDFLLKDLGDLLTEQQISFLERILKSSRFMLRMLDDLLDLSRIESGELKLDPKPADLTRLVREHVELMRVIAERKGIRLVIEPAEEIPDLLIDKRKIEQVLDNMLTNAIKYSHPGTAITVSVMRSGDGVRVAVADQGQGIPAEQMGRLFKPFSRTTVRPTGDERSTGLGLAICRRIVEGHGGEIGVESEVGRGSTFFFVLPLS